jgi:hypothetical protein
MSETVLGKFGAGGEEDFAVVDLQDGVSIEIRTLPGWGTSERIKIPKQAAHVLAGILRSVDVK